MKFSLHWFSIMKKCSQHFFLNRKKRKEKFHFYVEFAYVLYCDIIKLNCSFFRWQKILAWWREHKNELRRLTVENENNSWFWLLFRVTIIMSILAQMSSLLFFEFMVFEKLSRAFSLWWIEILLNPFLHHLEWDARSAQYMVNF